MKKEIAKYARWILGGVLLIAGILKLVAPDNLVEVLFFFGMKDEHVIKFLVYGFSVLELILAVALLLNLKPKMTSITVTLLFLNFLLISILGYTHSWELACGCLGEFTYGDFDLAMVLRNSVMLGMSALLIVQNYREKTPKRGAIKTKEEKS